jgi:hypothetical protein
MKYANVGELILSWLENGYELFVEALKNLVLGNTPKHKTVYQNQTKPRASDRETERERE